MKKVSNILLYYKRLIKYYPILKVKQLTWDMTIITTIDMNISYDSQNTLSCQTKYYK